MPLAELRNADGTTKCRFCSRDICARCGQECTAQNHDCTVRRPALRGALAGSPNHPFAPTFALESLLHSVFAVMQRRCASCSSVVFLAFKSEDAVCTGCGTGIENAETILNGLVTLLSERLRFYTPDVCNAKSAILMRGHETKLRDEARGDLLTALRASLHSSPHFSRFVCADMFCDALQARLEEHRDSA